YLVLLTNTVFNIRLPSLFPTINQAFFPWCDEQIPQISSFQYSLHVRKVNPRELSFLRTLPAGYKQGAQATHPETSRSTRKSHRSARRGSNAGWHPPPPQRQAPRQKARSLQYLFPW